MFVGGARNIYLYSSGKTNIINNKNFEHIINDLHDPNNLKFSSVHILGGIRSGEGKNCIVDSFGKSKKNTTTYL